MFRKLTIVTFAVLFVASSSASKDTQTAKLKKKVKEFELCTNDQAEFYKDIYGYYGDRFLSTDSVKSLYDCEAGKGAQPIAVFSATCSNPGIQTFGNYDYDSNVERISPGGIFTNGSRYRFDGNGIAPVVNCQETFLFLNASDNAKKAKTKKATKFGPIYNTITNNYAMVLDSPDSMKACIGGYSFNYTYPCSLATTGCSVGNVQIYTYSFNGTNYCLPDQNYEDTSFASCLFGCYEANYERANTNAFTSGYDIAKSKVEAINYDETPAEKVYTFSYKGSGWNPLY